MWQMRARMVLIASSIFLPLPVRDFHCMYFIACFHCMYLQCSEVLSLSLSLSLSYRLVLFFVNPLFLSRSLSLSLSLALAFALAFALARVLSLIPAWYTFLSASEREDRKLSFDVADAAAAFGKGVFITNVKGTFLGMSESEEASKRR